MTEFSFTVLGANSATPMKNRFPSSFILRYNTHRFLLDCGEGSQIKMSEFGIRRSKIDHIFISHLHGDHIFGLPGFLNSYNLQGRTRPLNIIGPKGIRNYLLSIQELTGAQSSFDVVFRELEGESPIDLGEIHGLHVTAIPLRHRIATFGYRFDETAEKININPDTIGKYSLSIEEIVAIKKGEKVVRDGVELDRSELIFPIPPRRSFAYCTDTVYFPELVHMIKGCSTIYHEATYTHDLVEKAIERSHSTAKQAAMIAHDASVHQLIIGHYSSRYKDLQVLENEARIVFQNSRVALEGEVYHI